MSHLHALIIEDNRNNAEVLTDLLENEGVSQTTLLSPRNLVETLDTLERLDVIFLDLEIPNYNGFQILSELQTHSRTSQVPVVAYTVHVSEVNEARDAGFHSFLGKPLDPQRFPHNLRQILNGERVWEY